MDWKQETILTLMGIPVIATMVYGISEVIEGKLKSLSYEYHNSFEYQRNLYKESMEEES